MFAPDVTDPRLRIEWSLARIDQFKAALKTFMDGRPYEIVANAEPYGEGQFQVHYHVKIRREAPLSLRYSAGDAIHNLRATIDNLVWHVGQKCGAGNYLSLVFKNTPEEFKKYCTSHRTHKLPSVIQDWLKDIQPFSRSDSGRHLLHVLTRLWNGDKHRTPALVAVALPSIAFGGRDPTVVATVSRLQIVKQGFVDDGDEVLTTIATMDQIQNFEAAFTFQVSFKEGETGIAAEFFDVIYKQITEDVFPKFTPFI